MRVVIFGDHKMYVDQIRQALSEINVLSNNILVVSNLETKSLEQAKLFKVDFIIVNYTLTYEDAIKIFQVNPNAYVLYLSSEMNQAFNTKLYDMGIDKIIFKPYPLSSLRMYFDELLDKMASNDSNEIHISLVPPGDERENAYYKSEEPTQGFNFYMEEEPPNKKVEEGEFHFTIESPEENKNVNIEEAPLNSNGPKFEIEDEEMPCSPTDKGREFQDTQSIQTSQIRHTPAPLVEAGGFDFSVEETVINESRDISRRRNMSLMQAQETRTLEPPIQRSQELPNTTGNTSVIKETEIYIKPPINRFESKTYYPHAATEDESIYVGLENADETTKTKKKKSMISSLISKVLRH